MIRSYKKVTRMAHMQQHIYWKPYWIPSFHQVHKTVFKNVYLCFRCNYWYRKWWFKERFICKTYGHALIFRFISMPSLLLLHCKPADKLKMFYITSNYIKYQKVKSENQFFEEKICQKKRNWQWLSLFSTNPPTWNFTKKAT